LISSINPADIGLHVVDFFVESDFATTVFTLFIDIQGGACDVSTIAPVTPIADMTYTLGDAPLT